MLHSAIGNALEQVVVIVDCMLTLPEPQKKQLYQSAGVGRHIRHITDHFLALKKGLGKGVIDYNQRNRDSIVEKDPEAARKLIIELINWLQCVNYTQERLEVLSEIDCLQTVNQSFSSCCERELLYLINHTVHHAAYVKLLAKTENVTLPEHIGIAPSTATFLRESGANVHA